MLPHMKACPKQLYQPKGKGFLAMGGAYHILFPDNWAVEVLKKDRQAIACSGDDDATAEAIAMATKKEASKVSYILRDTFGRCA